MKWYSLAQKLSPGIQKGETQPAVKKISDTLRKLPHSPFHRVLDLDFTNPPETIAACFDQFLLEQKSKYAVGAVYTETNGFDINPDSWYFDLFAYTEYGGLDDCDWLSDWNSGEVPSQTLSGMEELQEVYASDEAEEEKYESAREFCSLLVVVKFQDLIRRSVPPMRELSVPLVATGHGFDLLAEFRR